MKILQVHTKYQQFGGEDTTVQQEQEVLSTSNQVETLFFQNKKGFIGLLQFFGSIWNIIAYFKLKQKIKSFKPDIIHIHNWHFASGPILIRACHRHKIPVVVTIQNYRLLCPSALLLHNNDLFTDSLYQNFPWTAVRKGVYRNSWIQTFWLAFVVWFHKKIGTWKRVNKYICLTPFAVDLYQQSTLDLSIQKFTIKPNFSYLPDISKRIERENHFLFIGRISEEKGIRLLIQAFEKSKFKLKIAGSGPLTEYVIDKCNQNPNIEYIGNLDKKGVVSELMKCSALVFPSIWYEGMPLIIIESFACSTPIIASNLGAMSSMIIHGENGLHFNSNNIVDLKKKIEQWTSFSDAQKEIFYTNSFHHFSRIYTHDKQLALLQGIYQGVINP
jgi:glycosyltransferase involved in cell wall biosynthesis